MDTKNRTSRKAQRVVTALLTTLAFALGFAEFVLIRHHARRGQGLGEPLTLIGDLVGYAGLHRRHAHRSARHGARRPLQVMAALLVVFNAGNLLTLFADNYALLLVSRVLPPSRPALLALALTYVPDIVEPKRVAAVLGLVLAGFSVSSVVGVPIGAALADLFDWKAAYACVFALGLAVSAVLLPTLPRTPAHAEGAAPTLRSQLLLLADGRVLTNIAMILAAGVTYVFYHSRHPRRRRQTRCRGIELRAVAVRRGMRGIEPACRAGLPDASGCARCPSPSPRTRRFWPCWP